MKETVIIDMKLGSRFLPAIYAAFLLNTIMVFLWGDSGLVSMKELDNYRDRLVENVNDLKQINTHLTEERDLLLHDSTEIELRARTLGYNRTGEVKIMAPGSAREEATWTLGSKIRRVSIAEERRGLFRVVALCVGLVVFGMGFLFPERKNGSQTR